MEPKTPPNAINKMQGTYTCPELKYHPNRPGCMDAYKLPSRSGNILNYPTGIKEQIK